MPVSDDRNHLKQREESMQARVREFCLRHGLHFHGDPQPLSGRAGAWLIEDRDGNRWVVKARSPQSPTVELLSNFKMLHPPFRFTDPVCAEPNDTYWLYRFLDGTILADGPFDEPWVIEQVMELAGRLQALLRSLILVPFYRETLRSKETDGAFRGNVSRFDLSRIQTMDDRQKSARHLEIAQSYQWTEKQMERFVRELSRHPLCSKLPLAELRDRLHSRFSIHLPTAGSNLAHTALHPEHLLLLHAEGPLGVVGWHIAPRPRFYMLYTYLAWGLLHSSRADAAAFYREYLRQNSSRAFYEEHHLVFAFCLMEQLVIMARENRDGARAPVPEREREALGLLAECADNLSRQNP